MLNVLLIEAYYGGSHRLWADGYQQHSSHHIHLLTLPAQAWKWRMQGGAVTLARIFLEGEFKPDIVLASDMMNLATFQALTRSRTADIPFALYFHENQLTYPQNSRQHHGWRYGFINYVSAMSADKILFNSHFHMNAFFDELPRMLKHFYDYNELASIDILKERASVLPLGLDLERYDEYTIASEQASDEQPLIVWNHRWEEDKNPQLFLKTLLRLIDEDIDFGVAIVGEKVRHSWEEFDQVSQALGKRLLYYGFVPTFEEYAQLLQDADYVVSTAYQEFFGGSVTEAIYCGCVPVLPNRLNYPALIPELYHEQCLYDTDDDFFWLLMKHLQDEVQVNIEALRSHIVRFDWTIMAPIYDDVLAKLVQ